MGVSKKKNALQYMIKNLAANETIQLYEGGEHIRDYMYVDDTCEAIMCCIKKAPTGEIINIGSNKPIKIKDLINKICFIVGSGKPVFGKIKMRKDETMALYPNIDKANKVLNWRPKISLNAGLKKTIQWIKKNYSKFSDKYEI